MDTEISKEEQQRKDDAKKKIAKLVYEFKEDIVDSGKIKNYNEENVKMHFITPLFKALGWKMNDQNEVLYEENIYGKRADYLFILNGKKSLIVEAKQPNKSLALDTTSGISVAKQVISYAWHKQIPIAVATDFEELFVYHALTKPLNPAKNLMLIENKDFSLKFTEFIDKFELLWLLSRDSFEGGRLDKYLKKDAKKHKTVDKSILEDLVHIRNWLTKDVKKYNQDLPNEEIDEVVQKLIDRLIFIRSVEDRGLENRKDWLLSIVNDAKEQRLKKTIIAELREVFKHFDTVYNSKLFAKARIDDDIKISNEVLGKVIFGLYFGTASGRFRYEFDQISVDLLGSIYEQYLGMLLRSTEKRVKLEEGKSKRKKMGIYYTPQYIVDYIVRNTVGEYMKGKSLKEIEDIKILDPACGSGSFLQRAYDEVKEEVKRRIENGEKHNVYTELETVDGEKKLKLGQKQHIIVRNIHGVDLDEQAVEIAQLSLLLKLLEGESSSTKKKRLPMLRNNIQCGNSLIDDYEIAGDKAFKWESRFKDIMDNGGFDVIVGNPPYVRVQNLKYNEIDYYKNNFSSASKRTDIYLMFYEKAINILNNGGRVGFISSIQFINSEYGEGLRKLLLKNKIIEIIDFGDLPLFSNAVTYTGIFIIEKGKPSDFLYTHINSIDNIEYQITNNKRQKISINNLSEKMWVLQGNEVKKILNKINNNPKLNEIAIINTGCFTGKDESFFVDDELIKKEKLENDIIKPVILGKEPKRYILHIPKRKSIYPYQLVDGKTKIIEEKDLRKNYPNTFKYLQKHKKSLLSRRDSRVSFSESGRIWYSYTRKGLLDIFNKEKIIVGYITNTNNFCIDEHKNIYGVGRAFSISLNNPNYKLNYLLAILCSKLYLFLMKKECPIKKGGFFKISSAYLNELPIKKISPEQQKPFIKLANRMLDLNKQLQQEKSDSKRERLQQQIKDTDYEIDQRVYKLYGLTKEEIKIVEDNLK
jgi:hypothetical protein